MEAYYSKSDKHQGNERSSVIARRRCKYRCQELASVKGEKVLMIDRPKKSTPKKPTAKKAV